MGGDVGLESQACRQLARDQTNHQHHREGQQVLHIRHRKRQARRYEEKIERRHVHERRQHRRAPAQPHRHADNGEQEHHHDVGQVEERCQRMREQRGDSTDGQRVQVTPQVRPGGGQLMGRLAALGCSRAQARGLSDLDAIDVGRGRANLQTQRARWPPRARHAVAQHQLRQVVRPRIVDQPLRDVLCRQHCCAGTEVARQLHRLQDALAACVGQALQGRCFDIHRVPADRQLLRQPRCAAHHMLGPFVRADATQQRAFGLPHLRHPAIAAPGLHIVFHAVGGAAQCQLAQGHQVALAEEVLRGPLGLRGQVHLASGEALDQLVGRRVDQHHLGGRIEKSVGQRLVHRNAGDAADHVVQAFEVLHVERGVHIDACGQQLLDVLPALGVARARHVGVRQFVDQQQAGLARQCAVEVELGQLLAAVRDLRRG